MKKLLLLALGGLALSALAMPEGFIDDYDLALKRAKNEKKLVLAAFTGSDWCGACIKLEREVFSQPEFYPAIKDDFVLLMIDRPKNTSKLSEKAKAENGKICGKYGIRGFPTVLFLDAEGNKLHSTGYQPGGAAVYATNMKNAKRTLEIGKIEDKAEKLKAEHEFLKDKDTFTQVQHRATVQKILAADPDGKLGYRPYYTFFTVVEPVDNRIAEIMNRLNEKCGEIKAKYPGDEAKANAEIKAKLFPKMVAEFKRMQKNLKAAKVCKKDEGDKAKVLAALQELIDGMQ